MSLYDSALNLRASALACPLGGESARGGESAVVRVRVPKHECKSRPSPLAWQVQRAPHPMQLAAPVSPPLQSAPMPAV